MYKSAIVLYFITLFCYIIFSRIPDYFEGEFVKGVVIQKPSLHKYVEYHVGKETLTAPIKGWGASQVAKADTVIVIYNPDNPSEATRYSFFSYWFTLPEILISAAAFILLFLAAVFITGREEPDKFSIEEDKPRKRRYDD